MTLDIETDADIGIEIEIMTAEGYLDQLTNSEGMDTLTGRCSYQASSVCMIWTGLGPRYELLATRSTSNWELEINETEQLSLAGSSDIMD